MLLLGIAAGYLLFRGAGAPGTKPETSPQPVSSSNLVGEKHSESGAGVLDKVHRDAVIITADWLDSLGEQSPLDRMAAFCHLLSGVRLESYPALMHSLRQGRKPLNYEFIALLEKQWALLDPEGLFAYADTAEKREQASIRSRALQALAEQDLHAAWERALQLDDMGERWFGLTAVMQASMQERPAEVFDLLQELEGLRRQDTWLMQRLFQEYAQKDLQAACQHAVALPFGKDKQEALAGIISTWGGKDPLAALAWLNSLPQDSAVYQARMQLAGQVGQLDFERVVTAVESDADPELRRILLSNFNVAGHCKNKTFDEILGVYDWYTQHATLSDRHNRDEAFVRAMAGADLERAKGYVAQMSDGSPRLSACRAMTAWLAQDDPVAGVEYALSLEGEVEQRRALGAVNSRLMNLGAEAVAQVIADSKSLVLERQMAGQVMSTWSAYNRDAAMAWMAGLSDPDAIRNARFALLRNWISDDADEAFVYINSLPEAARNEAFSVTIRNTSNRDPLRAIELLERASIQDWGTMSQLYRSVTDNYATYSPMEASRWIDAMEPGRLRDTAAESLVNVIREQDPDSAFIWGVSLGDATARRLSLLKTIRKWAEKDSDAALQAIKDARMDAEEKKPLFELIEELRNSGSTISAQERLPGPYRILG